MKKISNKNTPLFSRIKIIAGKLRGRFVEFPDAPGIRPTPNRVRETLFNWLMQDIQDAICLDAFAGSGVLGMEALSRGATEVFSFEKQREFAASIHQTIEKFSANDPVLAQKFHLINEDFFSSHLRNPLPQCNIIFLDPPFHQNLLPQALNYLQEHRLLANRHCIYFEAEKSFDISLLPKEFTILKQHIAGQVLYGLGKVVV